MAKNLTEADSHAANVTVPEGGDPRTAASVETGFQQLADRTNYAHRRITGAAAMPVSKADTTAGAELASVVTTLGQQATSPYWLLEERALTGTSEKLRVYAFASGSGNQAIVYTRNAAYDVATAAWAVDTAGSAQKVEIGTRVLFAHALAATTSGGWTDAQWVDGLASLTVDEGGPAGVLQLAGLIDGAAPAKNTLYADNILQAWGCLETDGAGGVTLYSHFGVSGLSLSGGSVIVTFDNAFDTTTSVVRHMCGFGNVMNGTDACLFQPLTGTTAALQVYPDLASAQTDLSAVSRQINFHVCGKLA